MQDYKLALEQHKARIAAGKSQSPNGKKDPFHGLTVAQKKKIIMKRLGKGGKQDDEDEEISP